MPGSLPRAIAILVLGPIAALLLIGGSLLPWAQQSFVFSSSSGQAPAHWSEDDIGFDAAVTGTGGVQVRLARNDHDRDHGVSTPEADAIVGSWQSHLERRLEQLVGRTTTGVGIATVVFGALVLAGAVAAVVRQRFGSLIIVLAAMGAIITTVTAAVSPGILLDPNAAARLNLVTTSSVSVGFGLWITLAGAAVGLVTAAIGLVPCPKSVRPGRSAAV